MQSFNKFFMPKQMEFFDQLKALAQFQREMAQLFKSFVADFGNISEFALKAKDLEQRADMKSHEIVDHLNKIFITPIDREDLYLLAHQLDEIVDLIENVISNIQLYEVKIKNSALDDFADVIDQASQKLVEMVDHFQEQKRTTYLLDLKQKIHSLEDQGDEIFKKAIQRLFREEKDPITLIKWKDLLEDLEEVMDQYQSLSDVLEGVIVKSS